MNVITAVWQYLRAFIVIYSCLWLGNWLAAHLPIKIPGSILGMVLLFMLLVSRLLPEHWVKPGCTLLIRYMALLFVPIGVGVMNYYQLLIKQFGPLIVSCTLSTLITLLIVAFTSQYLSPSNPHRHSKGE